MKFPVSILAGALLWSGGATLTAEEIPFYVSVVKRDAKALPVVGIPAPDLTVIIRNNTSDKAAGVIPPRALVLRGVEWVGGRADIRRWHGPMAGAVNENADHTFSLNPNVARLTSQSFERGLMLPGDEIRVKVPLTRQSDEPPVLKITYAWAGDSSQWSEGVFLPVQGLGDMMTFVPATSDLVAARLNRGGVGALRATLAPDAAPAAEQTFTVPVDVPLGSNPDYQLTGGISIIEAAWKSGADKARGPWRGSYSAALHTWFYTAAGGQAVAFERVLVEHPPFPPTAPPGYVPKPWKWTVRELPAMDLTAPDEFGRSANGNTAIKLDAPTFGALLPVAEPGQGRYPTTGETKVPADKFWAVLNLAREKGLHLRLTTVAPVGGEPWPLLEFSPPSGTSP